MGRRKKAGARRTASGRLSRAAVATFDKGTERVQAMQELYGQDGCDALGRAYRHKLFGEGSEGKAMLDTGRRIANAYWATYATGTVICALGGRTYGSAASLDHERAMRREEWLHTCLSAIDAMGPHVRRCFDHLVIDVNPDHGPDWLDRLIGHGEPRVGDRARLTLALSALKAIVDGT